MDKLFKNFHVEMDAQFWDADSKTSFLDYVGKFI